MYYLSVNGQLDLPYETLEAAQADACKFEEQGFDCEIYLDTTNEDNYN